MPWYLVKTKSRCTLKAHDFYNSLDVKNYIPTTKLLTSKGKFKVQPLLPGYIFINIPFKLDYGLINLNPYTTDLIKRRSVPVVIPNDQMELMMNHVESIYKLDDFNAYIPGDTICIDHGSLAGLNGNIVEIKNNKIYIQIEGFSAKVSIEYNR